jgi:hypothetical protein
MITIDRSAGFALGMARPFVPNNLVSMIIQQSD